MSQHALLGPTNTGKTHRAIERMLEFESGMIGLPLRLLAREVYDKLTLRVGEQAVALVTGEEKRVPQRPRYWVCTVEAMPQALEVDFAAVDEIQLVAHPERGHVFTDRLLHLRGRAETWFMGAETAENVIRAQLPLARIRKLPRLSTLRYTGRSSLRTLPRRSAVVAFSLPQVYELADLLRVRRGGAAVVLGALSPRVRNAQVALYQAGEVDFLVATDAIGMGLNLDIDHVALAGRVKFDGFEQRELTPGELSQIAGRAGRYLKDGSFGVLSPEPELSPALVEQLIQHRFSPLRHAYYRNSDLDFTSLQTLREGLERRPRGALLRAAPDADDVLCLRVLEKNPEVSALSRGRARVEALWELCRIPNYEKRIPEHQAARLVPWYRELIERGTLSQTRFEQEVQRLDRYTGDIDALTERLSAIRTFRYISQKPAWLEHAESWQKRTQHIEERLGDVLHQKLLERFVSARPARRALGGVRRETAAPPTGSPFAKLAQLLPSHAEQAQPDLVERVLAAEYAELPAQSDGVISFEGQRVARLVRGSGLLHPNIKLLIEVTPSERARLERRLRAHLKDLSSDLLSPLHVAGPLSPPLRGLLYQLEQGLGSVPRRSAQREIARLSADDRGALAAADIVLGRDAVFASASLTPARLVLRHALARLDDPALDALVDSFEHVSADEPPRRLSARTLARLGFVRLGRFILRCDVAHRLRTELEKSEPKESPSERFAALLGDDRALAEALLRVLTRTCRGGRA